MRISNIIQFYVQHCIFVQNETKSYAGWTARHCAYFLETASGNALLENSNAIHSYFDPRDSWIRSAWAMNSKANATKSKSQIICFFSFSTV